jgi:hypothetical protein
VGWRIVLIPLVGAILVSWAANGMAPQVLAQQTIALGAPKWDAGDQWAWQIGNDQITWTVLSATGEYVVLEKSARETGIFHVAADFSSTTASSSYFLPPFFELQFPLALGKVWTYTKRVGDVSHQRLPSATSVEVEVTRITEGVVSITVPGGSFEAVRIFGRSHSLGIGSPYSGSAFSGNGLEGPGGAVPAPDRGDFVVWYAPQAKQVVKITWQGRRFWPSQYERASMLLVSYKLHNR